MTQVFFRRDHVTHQAFQFGNFRKPALGPTRLDDAATGETDLEDTALGAGHQGDRLQIVLEGAQQFLGHPGSADQPPALGAVFNFDAGSGVGDFVPQGKTGYRRVSLAVVEPQG